MRERQDRAYGPYKRGRLWRVVESTAAGEKSTCSFASEKLALEYIAEYNDEAHGRTMSGVLDEYLRLRKGDIKPKSHDTLGYRLKAFLRVTERDRLLSQVDEDVAAELYRMRVAETKADTHRAELAAAGAMFAWCIERGWVARNPFDRVKPVGRKRRRTEHLRIDEARKFLEACLNDLTDAGLACAIAVLLGLRASEVINLRVRDIDDGARVLWVDESKSEAGERHLSIPEVIRTRLRKKIANRPAGDRLFGTVGRHWLAHHVERLCELAEVQAVGPHALRRTWSALAAEALPIEAVSAALGHASTMITKRHYQPTNAVERRSGATAAAALVSKSGNRSGGSGFPSRSRKR